MSDGPEGEDAPTKRVIRAKPIRETKKALPGDAEPEKTAAATKSAVANRGALLPANNPVARWFAIICVVGASFHLFSLFPVRSLQLLGWAAPILATIIYPLIGVRAGWHKTPASREKFADNCYYLGFIFTQVALVVGFIPMTFLNRELGSQDVLRAFSVALGASLVGLVVRTVLIQSIHTVSENADIVEDELDALARAVSMQASKVLTDFERLGSRLTETYAQLNNELEQCVGQLVVTVKRYDQSLTRDAGALDKATSEIQTASQSVATKMVQSGNDLLERTTTATTALMNARREVEGELGAAIAAIKATGDALSRSASTFSVMPDLLQSASDLQGKLSNVGQTITTFEADVGRAQQEVVKTIEGRFDAAADRVSEFSSKLTEAGNNIDSAERRQIETLAEVARTRQEEIARHAAEFEEQVTAAARQLEDTLKRFKETLDETNG